MSRGESKAHRPLLKGQPAPAPRKAPRQGTSAPLNLVQTASTAVPLALFLTLLFVASDYFWLLMDIYNKIQLFCGVYIALIQNTFNKDIQGQVNT